MCKAWSDASGNYETLMESEGEVGRGDEMYDLAGPGEFRHGVLYLIGLSLVCAVVVGCA